MRSPPVGSAVGSGASQPVRVSSRRTAAASVLYCHGENSRMWRHCSMAAPAVGAGLENQRFKSAFDQVCCRGEADGPGSDDGNGKGRGCIHGFLCFIRWWHSLSGACRFLWDRQAAEVLLSSSRGRCRSSPGWCRCRSNRCSSRCPFSSPPLFRVGQAWVGSSTSAVAMLSASSSAAR